MLRLLVESVLLEADEERVGAAGVVDDEELEIFR